MYTLGAVETFQKGFGFEDMFPFDRQLIGIAVVIALAAIVYVGVDLVNKVASLFLLTVIVAIVLGLGGLIAFAAGSEHGATDTVKRASSVAMSPDYTEDPDTGITPTFQLLVGIIYPATTGIMAGANRSGLLADPSVAIPYGTISAITVTTILYVICMVLLGSIVDRETLLTNKLVFASVAYPIDTVVQVGILMSSIGAGLQSLVGAPQLLAVMLKDDVLPFVHTGRHLCQWCSRGCCGEEAEDGSSSRGAGAAVGGAGDGAASSDGPSAEPGTSPEEHAGAYGLPNPTRMRPAVDETAEDRADLLIARARARARAQTAEAEAATGRQTATVMTAEDEEEDANMDRAQTSISRPASSDRLVGQAGGSTGGSASASRSGGSPSGRRTPDPDSVHHREPTDAEKAVLAEIEDDINAEKEGGRAGFMELAVTAGIAACCCLAGNLDVITPIQTEFFLMFYLSINLATLVLTLYPTPNWRPTTPAHWMVSLFGVITCLVVMLIVSWWQALLAAAMAIGLFYWI